MDQKNNLMVIDFINFNVRSLLSQEMNSKQKRTNTDPSR